VLQVALTGGIGSGKSLAAEYFAELGAAVIDFDQLARDVIERGSEGFNEVLARFGDEILVEGGIDRKKLATIIFSDPQARADLEAIVHPRTRAAYAEFLQAQSGDAIVIAQIPLLAESTHEYAFDLIITVSADREIRMARLRDRGMKDFQIAERMAVQASDEQRETIAQIVINNSGSSDELLRQVENIYEDRLKPMSRITEDQGE
jgi:dephospho-CoA kinase